MSVACRRSDALFSPCCRLGAHGAPATAASGGESRHFLPRLARRVWLRVFSRQFIARAGGALFSRFADPRFEGGGGSSKLNYDIFRKAYGFLGTYQDSEIEELKKSLKKEKNQVSLLVDVLKQGTRTQSRAFPAAPVEIA